MPTNFRVKVNENKEIDKYIYFDREQKRLWNMKLTAIPILADAFIIVPKNLGNKLDE